MTWANDSDMALRVCHRPCHPCRNSWKWSQQRRSEQDARFRGASRCRRNLGRSDQPRVVRYNVVLVTFETPKPTRAELLAAYGTTIPDLVGPGMRVLLVGINPSLWSGWAGVHFARPANRLWRTLYEAGFSDRLLHPSDTAAL